MDAVNICLVGHRGVGKTTFLKNLKSSREGVDLDEEIARASGRSIEQIFADEGEAGFRARETACLADVLARPGAKVIAVGAGYAGPKPDACVVWLRRETDAAGRIFLDRPRLNQNVSPLDEYRERFAEREARYRAWADQILTLPEGYVTGLEDALDGAWTIPHDVTVRPDYVPSFRARRFEVRDDLGEVAAPPVDQALLRAYRTPGVTPPPADGVDEDWALELGPPPRAFAIVSAHEGSLDDAIERLARANGQVQKLAIEVHSFSELAAGHRWWLADPNGRAFLPRATGARAGRWRWYRSLFGPRMPLHFVREDEGTALDQPFVWQTRLQPKFEGTFAAVLGSPVAHSRTPLEQRDFFAARGRPVVAIDLSEDEWSEAWSILMNLGLTHAAVTAPLKARAFRACDEVDASAHELGAVNTLYVDGGRVCGTNTDVTALKSLARELREYENVWLWGGGGVKAAVHAAWPSARDVSARRPERPADAPDLVIWAVGRDRAPALPPADVRPRLILDLNYADDSPGLEWAAREGLAYRSGLDMFRRQAAAQRKYWVERERSSDRARESVW